jgi:hypothetical protein
MTTNDFHWSLSSTVLRTIGPNRLTVLADANIRQLCTLYDVENSKFHDTGLMPIAYQVSFICACVYHVHGRQQALLDSSAIP